MPPSLQRLSCTVLSPENVTSLLKQCPNLNNLKVEQFTVKDPALFFEAIEGKELKIEFSRLKISVSSSLDDLKKYSFETLHLLLEPSKVKKYLNSLKEWSFPDSMNRVVLEIGRGGNRFHLTKEQYLKDRENKWSENLTRTFLYPNCLEKYIRLSNFEKNFTLKDLTPFLDGLLKQGKDFYIIFNGYMLSYGGSYGALEA